MYYDTFSYIPDRRTPAVDRYTDTLNQPAVDFLAQERRSLQNDVWYHLTMIQKNGERVFIGEYASEYAARYAARVNMLEVDENGNKNERIGTPREYVAFDIAARKAGDNE